MRRALGTRTASQKVGTEKKRETETTIVEFTRQYGAVQFNNAKQTLVDDSQTL